MKIIKHIPEAHLSVAELDDGTRLTISADSLAADAEAAAAEAEAQAALPFQAATGVAAAMFGEMAK